MARSRIIIAAELKEDRLGHLRGELRHQAGKAVREVAMAIQIAAQDNAPVDTGALKNSIYTSTARSSSYDEAQEKALKSNPQAQLLPEVEPPRDDLTAIVAVGAEYGVYVEMGAEGRPAQPYLGPAAEAARPAFEAAMRKLLG